MKKLLLIKTAALSVAISAAFGLTSCSFGGFGNNASEATTSTSLSTEPTADTTATSQTETESPKEIEFNASKKISAETTEKKKSYHSKNADECALIVNGSKKKTVLNAPSITKSGDAASTDISSRYGVNSALLVIDIAFAVDLIRFI